jgi:hypothetical protein
LIEHTRYQMDRNPIQVISLLVVGLFATGVTASETAWEPLSFSDPGAQTTFDWIPAAAPVPGIMAAGSITTVVGSRSLGGAGWRNLGPAYQAGLDWSPGPASWPVRPIIGYRHARGEGEYSGSAAYELNLAQLGTVTESSQRGTLTAEVDEVALGVGRSWSWGMLHTSLGAGGCWVRAQVQDQPSFTLLRRLGQAPTTPSEDAGSGYGWWGAASASIAFGKTVVGLEGRYTDAPVTVFGDKLQAGGWQLGGSVGWSW